MSVVIITGSAGLVGSESAKHFASAGLHVVGIDNNMRQTFFGPGASTESSRRRLELSLGNAYTHLACDVRDAAELDAVFTRYGRDISVVVHTAAQPSHDWAVRDPQTDFSVNANGTLNMLQVTQKHAPDAAFIFTSTNKVYGDRPNSLPLVEQSRRWEIDSGHEFATGISERMSIDSCLHSLFGASKVAADILVQEFGRYFGLKTACFRAGCITGPNHAGAELHGFLAYLIKCCATRTPYTVFGYRGKQVRDNIHSADLVAAFDQFVKKPLSGRVYNIGGGRFSNCSMLEAIELCQEITGKELTWSYVDQNRIGDHIWWISDYSTFQADYPAWRPTYDVARILQESFDANRDEWLRGN